MSVCTSDNILRFYFGSPKKKQLFEKASSLDFGHKQQGVTGYFCTRQEKDSSVFILYLGTLKSGGGSFFFSFLFFLCLRFDVFDEMGVGGNAQQYSTEAQHGTAQHSDWRDRIRKRERHGKDKLVFFCLSRFLVLNWGELRGSLGLFM